MSEETEGNGALEAGDSDLDQSVETDGHQEGAAPPRDEPKFTQADVDRMVKQRAERIAAKKYGDYAELKEQASKAKSVEDQLSELRKAMADRDVADMQRNGRLAVAQVQAKLAEAGLSANDMTGLFDLIDPVALLKDGEPDEAAITKLAKSLVRVAGRTTPDRDQGRRGGDGPVDMNQLIRRSVGINT
jgi:hypothetical protein